MRPSPCKLKTMLPPRIPVCNAAVACQGAAVLSCMLTHQACCAGVADSVAALVYLAQRCPQLEVDFEHTAAEYENLPLA